MLATFIIDAYKKSEAKEIATILSKSCDATTCCEWSSAGIYSFWDYYTHEVLYIGLAVDLADRFKQHNGIIPARDNTCKKLYIDEYFSHKEKLGYTIFVQSPLSQPITRKNRGEIPDEDISYDLINMRAAEDREDIKVIEGTMIEAYRIRHGRKPKWNKIKGSRYGTNNVRTNSYELIECITKMEPHPLVSKSSFRELETNPTFERYEQLLHALRVNMLYMGMDLRTALNVVLKNGNPLLEEQYKELAHSGYMKKHLIL